jgi:hypothetical protein
MYFVRSAITLCVHKIDLAGQQTASSVVVNAWAENDVSIIHTRMDVSGTSGCLHLLPVTLALCAFCNNPVHAQIDQQRPAAMSSIIQG